MSGMSIATKRGDDGTTDLLFGRRVAKSHPRVAACGAVDELSASLGLARVFVRESRTRKALPGIQHHLIGLMGELATHADDYEKYVEQGFAGVTGEMVDDLTKLVESFENEGELRFSGWAIPGESGLPGAAHLEMSRTICRRAEHCVALLRELEPLPNPEIGRYLNRLADVLWLMARAEESAGDAGDRVSD